MNLRIGRPAVLAVGAVAVAAAAARLAHRSRPVLTLPQQVRRRSPGPTHPDTDDLTDRPVPRSVAALSTPPHFEQELDEHEPDS